MVQVPRFRWSVDDYEKMIRHGILTENHKVELIRGEIIPKMPIGDLRASCLNRLTELFFDAVGKAATISVQNPIRLKDIGLTQLLRLAAGRGGWPGIRGWPRG